MMGMADGAGKGPSGGSGGPGGRGPPGAPIDPNAMEGFKMMDRNGDMMVGDDEFIDFNANMMGDSMNSDMQKSLEMTFD